jgi:hypothetical protein
MRARHNAQKITINRAMPLEVEICVPGKNPRGSPRNISLKKRCAEESKATQAAVRPEAPIDE